MKYQNERKAALLTAVLAMTVLFYTLILPASASALAAVREEHGHGRPPLRRSMVIATENGRITDEDGIIGNSLHGADAPVHPHRTDAPVRRINRSAERRIDGAKNAVGDVANGVKRAADHSKDDAERAADHAIHGARHAAGERTGDTQSATRRAAEEGADSTDSTTDEDRADSGSVIGWMVTVLIVLAIALIVLAMLPKKSKKRK